MPRLTFGEPFQTTECLLELRLINLVVPFPCAKCLPASRAVLMSAVIVMSVCNVISVTGVNAKAALMAVPQPEG
jgi:hypothetical protein